jgi:hypothetical protein
MSRDVLPEMWKAITIVAFVTLFVASLLVLHSWTPISTDGVAVTDQPS